MVSATSFRISPAAKTALADRAAREHTSATALLERLIIEGVEQLEYPGIIFRGAGHNRRAALAAGPDVWEVVSRLQDLDGTEEQRITTVSEETDLHPRLVRLALDYAATHTDEVQARIDDNRGAIEAVRQAVAGRRALLGHSA